MLSADANFLSPKTKSDIQQNLKRIEFESMFECKVSLTKETECSEGKSTAASQEDLIREE